MGKSKKDRASKAAAVVEEAAAGGDAALPPPPSRSSKKLKKKSSRSNLSSTGELPPQAPGAPAGRGTSRGGEQEMVPPISVPSASNNDTSNAYRKDQVTLIDKVGNDIVSPLRMPNKTNSQQPKGYVRGEMLTPSPPPGWHATPGHNRFGSKALGELGKEFAAERGEETKDIDVEDGLEETPVHARGKSYINYMTVIVTHLIIGYALGWRAFIIIRDSLNDGYWLRCAALAYYPAAYLFMLFSIDYLVSQCIYALGPIAHMQQNSKYFSSVPMPRPAQLPRITIQMPVYKESLSETILPSIQSLTSAILHYKRVGGEANILICDDGLAVIDPKERDSRIFTYKRHGCGYIARPHPSERKRAGLFKKASNMNYCLTMCNRVEQLIQEGKAVDPEQGLEMANSEINGEARCGGDVLVGAIILLVDSDTRVPEDCLAKVTGEFDFSPEVGFLQCKATSLRLNDNYWENMIARFTDDVYGVGIAMAVSSGDPAPLVGHNVFLRWSALKDVAIKDGSIEKKFWSEKHVSEDFDMALRLQTHGYIGRYCCYTGDGFQEGVSLTAVDEVIRLKKYAYGSCEIMLNKFKDWPCGGPITKMFRSYLSASTVPAPAKIRMVAYLSTYIAMAFSIYGIILYLFFWIAIPAALKFIVNPFDILITVCFVFGVMSVFGAAMITYRTGEESKKGIFNCFFNQIKNAPVMLLFFSHVLWHLTVVCFRYFFDMTIEWGASVKEADVQSFGVELRQTFQRYWQMFIIMFLLGGGFAACVVFFNVGWDPRVFVPIGVYVGSHILGPFLLNPTIMRGYY